MYLSIVVGTNAFLTQTKWVVLFLSSSRVSTITLGAWGTSSKSYQSVTEHTSLVVIIIITIIVRTIIATENCVAMVTIIGVMMVIYYVKQKIVVIVWFLFWGFSANHKNWANVSLSIYPYLVQPIGRKCTSKITICGSYSKLLSMTYIGAYRYPIFIWHTVDILSLRYTALLVWPLHGVWTSDPIKPIY